MYIYIERERERQRYRVDSNKLEYGPGTIYAGCPSSLGFGVAGQTYSNFLAFRSELPQVPRQPRAAEHPSQPHNVEELPAVGALKQHHPQLNAACAKKSMTV